MFTSKPADAEEKMNVKKNYWCDISVDHDEETSSCMHSYFYMSVENAIFKKSSFSEKFLFSKKIYFTKRITLIERKWEPDTILRYLNK